MTDLRTADQTPEPRLLGGAPDDGPVCPTMEIPQAWCAHCRARTTQARQRLRQEAPRGTHVYHRFYARWPGTCSQCGENYRIDDLIGITVSEKYVCEECA